mmetsp:Transcript_2474/g.10017  ORF Transcript_2474/g.10017 Transcript_2474/m.10017 type:complete len:232 (-) Transcript_2474:303-998(-)
MLRRLARGTDARPRGCHAQDDQALPQTADDEGDRGFARGGSHHARRTPRRAGRVRRPRALAVRERRRQGHLGPRRHGRQREVQGAGPRGDHGEAGARGASARFRVVRSVVGALSPIEGAGGREDQGRLRRARDGAVGDGQGERGGHGWSGGFPRHRGNLWRARAPRGVARGRQAGVSRHRPGWSGGDAAGRHLRRGSQQQRGSVEPGAREGEGERDVRAGRDVRGGYHRDG